MVRPWWWQQRANNDFCSNHRECTYGTTADCSVLEVSGQVPFKGYWLDTFCATKMKYICKLLVDSSNETSEDTSTARRLMETSYDSSIARRQMEPPATDSE